MQQACEGEESLRMTEGSREKAEPVQIGANSRPISVFPPQEGVARTIVGVKHFYLWRFAAKRRDGSEAN
jgi:hypothetical protein